MKLNASVRRRARRAGFSLLEMVIVLGIIAVILGGAITVIGGVGDGAKLQRIDGDFNSISSTLKMYKINGGQYPTTAQGLIALVEEPTQQPTPKRWIKYADSVPKDPWGNEYGYKFPGTKNPQEFELISKGKDGQQDTEDDISSQE